MFFNFATVRKVAFSASLLASSEGNTGPDLNQLIYRNVFTNTGNHYNPNTGSLIRLPLLEKLASII